MNINELYNNKFQASLIIFVIALILRISIISFYKVNFIPSDGVNYHNIAVNVALGRGYSNSITPPYNAYFFREPVYPLFISFIYLIYNKLGGELAYIPYSDNYAVRNEFVYVKIFQAIIDALSCIFIFLIFSKILTNKYAIILGIIYALYFPVAVQCSFYLRETLQMFIILLANIVLLNYLTHAKYVYIIILSILYATLILTFQIHILMFPYIILFLYTKEKNIHLTLKKSLIGFIIVITVLSPWLYRSYKYYPDIKIFKNVGLSFTSEQMAWVSSMRKALRYNLISRDEFYTYMQWWYSTPEDLKFKYSFDGTYKQCSDSIKTLIIPLKKKEPFSTKVMYQTNIFIQRVKNTFFRKLSLSKSSISDCLISHNILCYIPYILGIIIGIGGIYSFARYFKRLWVICMPYFFYLSIFYYVADEARRMIVVHGYLFMFFLILMTKILLRQENRDIFKDK